MKPKSKLLLSMVVVATCAIKFQSRNEPPRSGEQSDEGVTIEMIHSSETSEWLTAAAHQFQQVNPDIHVALKSEGSLEAAEELALTEDRVVVWSPADQLALDHYRHGFQMRFPGKQPYAMVGEDAPASLVRSPLVWIGWKSRGEVLLRWDEARRAEPAKKIQQMPRVDLQLDANGSGEGPEMLGEGALPVPDTGAPEAGPERPPTKDAQRVPPIDPRAHDESSQASNRYAQPGRSILSWDILADALALPGGWKQMGGESAWGVVKIGHADPTRSMSGLMALLSSTLEFFNGHGSLRVEALQDPEFDAWSREIHGTMGGSSGSTRQLLSELVRRGTTSWDFIVSFESMAISRMKSSPEVGENLHVYYLPVTIWSDHPVVLLGGQYTSTEVREAARKWMRFLREPKMQKAAMSYGLRPSDPTLDLHDASVRDNPFRKFSTSGIRVELPSAVSPQSVSVMDRLMERWRAIRGAEARSN